MKFLFIFLIIVGCKSNIQKDESIIIGTAINTKGGAMLANDDGVFKIEDLPSWESNFLNKKVKVKGKLKLINVKDSIKSDNPILNSLQPQNLTINYYSVSNAVWELYYSNNGHL